MVLRDPARWFVAGLHLFLAAAGLVSAVTIAGTAATALFALEAAVFLTLAVRGARSAIWVSREGVTAKADRFTRHLAWRDIERFELGPRRWEGLFPGRGLGAWLRDGKWVRLMDESLDPGNRYQAALDDLKAELARRQT